MTTIVKWLSVVIIDTLNMKTLDLYMDGEPTDRRYQLINKHHSCGQFSCLFVFKSQFRNYNLFRIFVSVFF